MFFGTVKTLHNSTTGSTTACCYSQVVVVANTFCTELCGLVAGRHSGYSVMCFAQYIFET